MEAVEQMSSAMKKGAEKNTSEIAVQSTGERVSVREKVCYGVGDIGANLVWTTVASFLTIYCTDVAGIAAGVVGTLMLIARLFDGVSDLFMGVIIDKTNTRWGKARPWVLWSAPPLVISLIMIFTVPDISANGKAIYLLLVYIFLAAVCFTASNLSYNTMLSLVTTEQHDRNVMNTFRFEFTMIAQLVINVITIPLVHFLGNGQKGWTWMSIIYAIVAMGMFLTTFLGTKERYKPIKKEVKKEKKHPVQTVKILCRNKYFILITLAFAVIYISLFLHGFLRTVQKHNTELITAKTHEQISRPDICLHRLNEIQQVTIPFLMPEMIIHIFQMIKITITKDNLLSCSKHRLRPFMEQMTISNPCKFVSVSLFFKFLFSFFQLLCHCIKCF